MKQEINPKDTNRAIAFELWTKSPMPMVTLTKTFDVTRLCKVSRKRGMKFNMLLCWCIGKAASGIEEFYMLPKDGKLYKYDRMAINVIADNVKGGLSFCDVAVSDDLERFNANYLHLTETISKTCQDLLDEEAVIVGTSASRHRGHIGSDWHGTRQHRQPVQRHLHQSLPRLGPLPQRLAEDDAPHLLPVPSRPDGRQARHQIPGRIAENN